MTIKENDVMGEYRTRARVLRQHFDIYGYGNFDLTIEDIADVLQALDSQQRERILEDLYVRLEAIRMV